MPMSMNRPEPLKGSTEGEGGARLLDDSDVEGLTAEQLQEEQDEEPGELERREETPDVQLVEQKLRENERAELEERSKQLNEEGGDTAEGGDEDE